MDCVPSKLSVKSRQTFGLKDVTDHDVNTGDTETEDGVSWTYRVLEFVRE